MTNQNPKSMVGTAKRGNSPLEKTKRIIMATFPLFRKSYTYISQEVSFNGDLSALENIVLDGKMQGNIRATKHVSLGPTAQYEGSIECESASISGTFTGCIRTTRSITVRVPAKITGDLISASVQVESGVILNGKIISTPQDSSERVSADIREQTLMHLVEPVEGK